MKFEFLSKSADETESIGFEIAKKLDGASVRRAFIALRGEMGVGKTAFVRGFARYFGISAVRSPTYTVVNEYSGSAHIYHFDMYRLSDLDDLFSVGYEDYIKKDGFALCEWSENIEDQIPPDRITVTIERVSESDSARSLLAEIPEDFIK